MHPLNDPNSARVEYRVDGRGTLQMLMINTNGQCFFTEATPRLIFCDLLRVLRNKSH